MEQLTIYVGLDVHKDTIAVAVVEDGKRGEVRDDGKIANTPAALTKLAGKLAGASRASTFCYEAGPCGYGISASVECGGTCVHCGCSIADPAQSRRPG